MGFSPSTKHRSWIATIQIANMERSGLTKEEYENPEILANHFISLWENSGKNRSAGIAICVSDKGLYHAHMACYGNTTTLKKVSEILFNSHVEPQLGGKAELKGYLEKSGKYEEKGEHVLLTKGLDLIQDAQGKRSDLDEIEELLEQGATPQEIFAVSFRYRKYEKMIKSEFLSRKIRETPLVKEMWNEYHWGESGTGKTYTYIKLCEKYSDDEVYLCNDYSNSSGSAGGFDFYSNNPAKIIILDEFRGNIAYSQLLSILDVYSRNQQHCRFQNTYNLWTSVIICSIYPPEKLYSNMVDYGDRCIDSIQQLLRRLNLIVYHYKENGEYKTFSMPANEYVDCYDMIQRALGNEIKQNNCVEKTNDSEQISDENFKSILNIE